MDIKTVPYGPLGSNMYIIMDPAGLIIIDPSVAPDSSFVARKMGDRSVSEVRAILMTHAHFDHTKCLDAWVEATGAPAYISADDKAILSSDFYNCSAMMDTPLSFKTVPSKLPEHLDLLGYSIRVIPTPGHTSGSVCFLFENENVLFSGDTLFAGSIGRSDLPDGNARKLAESLALLGSLPEDIVVYPGHGYHTTIAIEKKTNPYM